MRKSTLPLNFHEICRKCRVRLIRRVSTVMSALILVVGFASCSSTAGPGYVSQSKQGNLSARSKVDSAMLDKEVASYSFPNSVVSIAWSADGSRLAVSHNEDKSVTLVDRTTGRRVWTAEKLDSKYPPPCCRLLFSPDGSRLYTPSAVTRWAENRGKTVSVLDTRDGSIVSTLGYHEPRAGYAMALDIALSHDGKTLFAIPGATNEVIAYYTMSGEITNKFVANAEEREWGKGFSTGRLVFDEPRGRLWFAHQGTLLAWDRAGNQAAHIQAFKLRLTAMAVNPSTGDIVAGGTADVMEGRFPLDARATNVEIRTYADEAEELVRAFDGSTAKRKLTYIGPGGSVLGISVNGDGSLVAATKARRSRSEHHQLLVWDAASGRLLDMRDCGTRTIGDVAFSPDGRFLAYAENGSVKVLQIAR